MGNTSSDVNDSLKAQADGSIEVYKLVNLGGGGQLAELMIAALTKKDYTEVDNFIKNEVVKFLYNEGNGAQIPINEIVLKRIGGKPPVETIKNEDAETKEAIPTKEVCWRLDKTGAVGESLLHLCMLNGTKMFIQLAKRLLTHFPKMINDVYLGADYFGENALHMAIVSEDPCLVKYLLLKGADYHQRCCGQFFTPIDQRNNQINPLTQESPIYTVKTNYMAPGYFGEYPLSFAVILNQIDSARLLLAMGADPNKQDFNGNTALHMLVINNNLPMFKFLLEYKPSLHIKNRQNLTPLTLAAKLARKEMFDYILEQLRIPWFTYADISCGSFPLDTIDTVSEDGSTDTESAIYLIANGELTLHLDLLEGLVVDLIRKKWNSYIKNKFYTEFVVFFAYFILSATVLIMKRYNFNFLREYGVKRWKEEYEGQYNNETKLVYGYESCTETEEEFTKLTHECHCAYNNLEIPADYARFVLELILWLSSVAYLIMIGTELYIQKFKLFLKNLVFNPSKVFLILSLLCTLLIIPMRYSCETYGEDVLIVMSIVFKSTYILYLGRGFTFVTTFVFVIHKVISTNFVRFGIIFAIFLFGFSQSFYIVFDFGEISEENHYFKDFLTSIYNCIPMALSEIYEQYVDIRYHSSHLYTGMILFVLYQVLVAVILINLLIAMMVKTYSTTTELPREWLRQWSLQVLTVEQNIPAYSRLKHQKMYATEMSNGKRAYVVRWKQSAQERKELFEKKKLFQETVNNIENPNVLQDIE